MYQFTCPLCFKIIASKQHERSPALHIQYLRRYILRHVDHKLHDTLVDDEYVYSIRGCDKTYKRSSTQLKKTFIKYILEHHFEVLVE
jgi:hypothetical protein